MELFSKSVFSKIILIAKNYMKMSTHARFSPHTSYEGVVEIMNNFQPNCDDVRVINTVRDRLNILQSARDNLYKNGITMDDVDGLKIIHVSGTKGKGSTCAFCESILRHKGYKTGFFSSPHMVEVRERIRINGKALSKSKFTEYFHPVYNSLQTQPQEDTPTYFRFTLYMAMHVFLKEKVDVAIIEVGLGGSYDSTNFIRKPTVCGVTSLGLDHTDVLGGTLASIAWNKAGIFKPGTPAITVSQKGEGMEVLIQRAKEIGNPLYISTPLPIDADTLGIKGQIQVLNASLALQLCSVWLKCHSKDPSERSDLPSFHDIPTQYPSFEVTPDLQKGLSECFWPGRCQKVKSSNVTYYLDGAHTEDSMREASSWFDSETRKDAKDFKGRVVKVLMFLCTGNRDAKALMMQLRTAQQTPFDYAIFTTTILSYVEPTRNDLKSTLQTEESRLRSAFKNQYVWDESSKAMNTNEISVQDFENFHIEVEEFKPLPPSTLPSFSISQPKTSQTIESFMIPTIHDCLVWFNDNKDERFSYTPEQALKCGFKFPFGKMEEGSAVKEDLMVQVVCVGSFYLVGGVLNFIDPDLND